MRVSAAFRVDWGRATPMAKRDSSVTWRRSVSSELKALRMSWKSPACVSFAAQGISQRA